MKPIKPTFTVLLLLALLLALAGPVSGAVTLNLSPDRAYPGQSVTVSGTAPPDSWVSVRVLDESGSLVFFGAVPADSAGHYSIAFTVPALPPGMLHVFAGSGAQTARGTLTVLRSTGPPFPPPGPPAVERLSGADRYRTAVEICKAGWTSAQTVVLARGDGFADALAGVPLAHRLGAPLLLTGGGSLNPYTGQEIRRLGAARVVILGGTAAVPAAVERQLSEMGLAWERIGGDNRYATAALISRQVAPDGAARVILAYGENFPDALAASAYAARHGYPVLLAGTSTLPPETRSELQRLGSLNPGLRTVVVGGTAVIGGAVFDQLTRPERIWGADRYATAVALARYFAPPSGRWYVATGLDFPDAVTGGVLAARENSGILLVQSPLPSTVSAFLRDSGAAQIIILGGENAVSPALAEQLRDLLR